MIDRELHLLDTTPRIPYIIPQILFNTLTMVACTLMCLKLSASWLHLSLSQSFYLLFQKASKSKQLSPCRKWTLAMAMIVLTPISGMSVAGIYLIALGWPSHDNEMLITGIGLFTIGYLLVLCRSKRIDLFLFHGFNFASFLFIAGCTLLSFYFTQMRKSQVYTYHGPVYVTQFMAAPSKTLYTGQCGSLSCYDEGYEAQIQVGFGYEWACLPGYERIWCDSTTTFEECNTRVCDVGRNCSDDDKTLAKEWVIKCLSQYFNITTDFHHRSDYQHIFPTRQQQNEILPYITLFGDCQTCQTQITQPFPYYLLHPGSFLTYIGSTFLVILFMIRKRMLSTLQEEKRWHYSKLDDTATAFCLSDTDSLNGIHLYDTLSSR